jgi:hypothetical protein
LIQHAYVSIQHACVFKIYNFNMIDISSWYLIQKITYNHHNCSLQSRNPGSRLSKREENQLLVFERMGSPNDMRPKNWKLCLQPECPNALNVTKTNRLRYAGHMIRRPEDLPQKSLFRAKPNGRRNQGRP